MKKFVFLVLTIAANFSWAQTSSNYPSRPLKLVVPFAAGGPTDTVARVVAQRMAATLGQAIVVDNKPGADSTIGTEMVARAPADGYTVLLTTSSLAINGSIYPSLPYDPLNDFTHLGLVGTQYLVLAVPPTAPQKTIGELVSGLKKSTAQYNYGTSGSTIHLISELFHTRIGVSGATRINYRGNAPMLNGFFAGEMHYGFLSLDGAEQHIKAQKLRALAVTSPRRDPALPDVPTMIEAGIPDFAVGVWFSMQVRRGTPPAVVQKLHDALDRALTSEEVRELGRRFPGFVVAERMTLQAADEFVRSEAAKWAPIVKAAGIKPN